MPIQVAGNMGNIIIENNVIAVIAGISAMESYGVVGMASKNATDGLFQLFKFENLSKGIIVDTDGGNINIELHIIVEFGTRVSTIAQNIMDRVRFNVESMTGYEVEKVNIIVEDIRIK